MVIKIPAASFAAGICLCMEQVGGKNLPIGIGESNFCGVFAKYKTAADPVGLVVKAGGNHHGANLPICVPFVARKPQFCLVGVPADH